MLGPTYFIYAAVYPVMNLVRSLAYPVLSICYLASDDLRVSWLFSISVVSSTDTVEI